MRLGRSYAGAGVVGTNTRQKKKVKWVIAPKIASRRSESPAEPLQSTEFPVGLILSELLYSSLYASKRGFLTALVQNETSSLISKAMRRCTLVWKPS